MPFLSPSPRTNCPLWAQRGLCNPQMGVRPERLGVRLNINVPSTSPHPPTCGKQKRMQIWVCYGLPRPPFSEGLGLERLSSAGDQGSSPGSTGHPSGWPGGRQTFIG